MGASLVGTVGPQVSRAGAQYDSMEGICLMTPLGKTVGGLIILGNTGRMTLPSRDTGRRSPWRTVVV